MDAATTISTPAARTLAAGSRSGATNRGVLLAMTLVVAPLIIVSVKYGLLGAATFGFGLLMAACSAAAIALEWCPEASLPAEKPEPAASSDQRAASKATVYAWAMWAHAAEPSLLLTNPIAELASRASTDLSARVSPIDVASAIQRVLSEASLVTSGRRA
ncbi:MAG: hypothetical protein PSV22_19825 [Pseudolabrys sp.]|nr:hypothetical protein [Pseudolabrys sp.]